MIYHRFIIWGVLASILLTVVIMSCGGNADSDPDYPIISEVIEEKAVEPTQQPNLTITPVQISEKIVKKQVPKAQKASEKTLKSSSLSNNEKIAKSNPEVILPTTTALAETPVPSPTTKPNRVPISRLLKAIKIIPMAATTIAIKVVFETFSLRKI